MTRPLGRSLTLCVAAAALAAPAIAAGDPKTGGTQAPTGPATQGVIRASGPQVALAARAGTMMRHVARFRGTVDASAAGRTVAIERFARDGWTAIATATVDRDGSYLARWRPRRPGQFRVRAVLQSASQAVAAGASPELSVTVHRPALATWYGPGFYGRMTACGLRMSRTLLGVAHRTLACGTEVAVLYRGRRIAVPVVDRGPFRPGTDWDLTAATAQALRFEHTDRLGAVRLRTGR